MKWISDLRKDYVGVFQIGRAYFQAYGGWSALARSIYLHGAVLITLLLYSTWASESWWDIPMSVLPNVIGFSLGGYAILMGFGDESFRNALKGSTDGRPSPFLAVSATFVHFIFVQIVALVLALLAKGRIFSKALPLFEHIINLVLAPGSMIRTAVVTTAWGIGFGCFVYAILLTVAATLGVFRLSVWYDKAPSAPPKRLDP